MVVSTERAEQLARYYAANAGRLRSGVSRKTGGLDAAVIDDACAFAWERLVVRPDVDLRRPESFWWLYKVALREAWRLGRAQHREQPAGGLSGTDELPEPPSIDVDVVDLVADRVEHATLREVLGELHWRERRELLLYAHGLTWQEIAVVTGTSYTVVISGRLRQRRHVAALGRRRHVADGAVAAAFRCPLRGRRAMRSRLLLLPGRPMPPLGVVVNGDPRPSCCAR